MYFNQPPGQADASPASVGTLMQRSGGSLLQATLLAPPDADRAKLANVSLIAVPDPSAKTLKKHDLITIVVNENSQNSSKGDTALSKTTDFDAKLNNFILMNLSKMRMTGVAPSVAPELNFQTERDFTGTAAVDRADIVTDRITAEVIDVKPNNTVVLQARKRINTDEEKQEFIMTGVCRAEDVAADNTILSTQCYDLEIQKKNSGMVRDTTKRGFLTKMLDVIDPF
jgi:flagellar L-ring protein precursor FlgH